MLGLLRVRVRGLLRPTVETLSSHGLEQPRRRVEVLVNGDDLPALDAGNHTHGQVEHCPVRQRPSEIVTPERDTPGWSAMA